MTAPCPHQHGDQIDALFGWVCGQCYYVLPERPRRYAQVPVGATGFDRQEIVWMAEIRKSSEKTTLSDFMRTMAKRFQKKSRPPMAFNDAMRAALEELRALGEEFGDPALDWSHGGARELADEAMQDWERAEGNA